MAPSSYSESRCPCFWDYLLTMARIWGILTAAVMSGVGVDLAYHGHSIGTCVLLGSALVFLLEIAWAMSLLLHVLPRQDGVQPAAEASESRRRAASSCGCLRAAVRWCDKPSKKGMLYAVLGAVVLLWPQHHLWLSPIAGVMLLLLAGLNFLLTFKARGEARDSLLPGRDDSFERLDDVSDMLDDSLPEPIMSTDVSDSPRLVPRSASASLLAQQQHHMGSESGVMMSGAAPGSGGTSPSGRGPRAHALIDGFGDQEIILQM